MLVIYFYQALAIFLIKLNKLKNALASEKCDIYQNNDVGDDKVELMTEI